TRSKRDWSSDVCSSDLVAKSIDIGSEIKESSVNMYEKLQCDIDISYFDEVPLFRDDGETLYWSIDIISKQYGKFSTRAYNMLNKIGRASCREVGLISLG